MSDIFEILDGELVKYQGSDREIEIPNTITAIRDFAFYGCDQLEKVVISDGVTSIGSHAFYNCENLTSIKIPESVKFIGGGAFSSCKRLESITLPDSLKTIQKSTFYKCENLKEIGLPSHLKVIEHSAFGYCTKLSAIDLPATLLEIGANVFEECASLTSIVLPEGLTTVGDNAFFHCVNLHDINASKALKEVGKGAFQTHSTLSFKSNDALLLRSFMFDGNWNLNWSYSFRYKNGDNYCLVDSYLPHLNFKEWKPLAKIVLLTNFLETIASHQAGKDKQDYIDHCLEHRDELLNFIVEQKRFKALNHSLEQGIFTTEEIEPYFERITDREEKAKILNYNNQTRSLQSNFDDLENELLNMF